MNLILEIIMELFVEAGLEIAGNKKVPKVLRYLFMLLILGFYLFMGSLLLFAGIGLLRKNDGGGLFLIFIGVFLLLFIFFQCKNKIKQRD